MFVEFLAKLVNLPKLQKHIFPLSLCGFYSRYSDICGFTYPVLEIFETSAATPVQWR